MSDEQSKTILQTGLEIASDRIKNNFYGYLITSFVIFNWENIILILKSKNDIEMTLIYISAQPNFSQNFIWEPLKIGVFASFIMPMLSTIYSLIIGVITAFRDESRRIGRNILESFLAYIATSVHQRQLVSRRLAEQVRLKREEYNNLRQRIETSLEQKAGIDEFLLKIARVYAQNPHLNDEKDLEKIIKALYNEKLRDFYTSQNMIGRLLDLVEEQNKATVQIIAAAQNQANNAHTEK